MLSHFENLVESKKEGRHVYLVFDNELGSVLKTVFEISLDDDAIILSKAAKVLRKKNVKHSHLHFRRMEVQDQVTKLI